MELSQLQTPTSPQPTQASSVPLAMGGVLLLGGGLVVALVLADRADLAFASPFFAAAAIACFRRPAGAMTIVFAITAAIGSLIAFTGLPVVGFAEFFLASLWLGTGARLVAGGTGSRLIVWPGLLLLALYIGITFVSVFTADSTSNAFTDFRVTAWYMSAALLLAIAPWSAESRVRLAKGIAAVALLAGLYAIYRYIAGPSADEAVLARASLPGTLGSDTVRFFGSFLSAHQLAAWTASTIPFLLALALAWRGRWRLVAYAGIGMCAFAMFAADVRTGVLAAMIGTALTFVLFQLSRAFPGRKVGVGAVSLIAMVVVVGGGYSVAVGGDSESSDRFSRIFSPTEDANYQRRLIRWEAAVEEIDREPFGHGLGTSGFVAQSRRVEGQVGPYNLDSSYLKIGIQQGWLVMGFFILALITLLVGLAQRSIRTTDAQAATFGIGACGALAALALLFYAGTYIEGVTALSAWILIGLGAAGFSRAHDRGPGAGDQAAPPLSDVEREPFAAGVASGR